MGISKDKSTLATVYINSPKEYYPPGRKKQLLLLKSKGRDYLDWDSVVDCSDLKLKDYKDLLLKIIKRPNAVLGTISTNDFDNIKTKIISSPTITPIDKKEYGFFV